MTTAEQIELLSYIAKALSKMAEAITKNDENSSERFRLCGDAKIELKTFEERANDILRLYGLKPLI